MIWTLHLPGWTPTPLNKLLASHWGKAAGLKKKDREQLTLACRAYGVLSHAVKRRVELLVILAPKQRACDPDAYWKSLLDGLVQAGALVDDSRQWVETLPPKFARGDFAGSFVTIQDVL